MVVDAVRLLLAAETTCDMQSKREGEGKVPRLPSAQSK
jgi:hypothetical protein